jgi:hypothetical protein
MNDPIPDQRNRVAVSIGRVLHPFLLPIPTLLAILSGLPLREALWWFTLIISMILIPGIVSATLMQRLGNPLYQRQTRHPLYLIGWISVLLCLAVIYKVSGPPVLLASVATLVVWIPLQWAINSWVTKISTHAAVAAGCFTTLLVLGKLEPPLLQIGLAVLVAITLWARVVTRNHTLPQVVLGVLVGVLPVLLIFPSVDV